MECTKCHRVKDIPTSKRWCRECKNAYETERRNAQDAKKKEEELQKGREYYQRRKEGIQDREIVVDTTKHKVCTVCEISKTLDNFHLAKNKGTIRAMCKDCSSIKRKEYYKKNKADVVQQTTQYQIEKIKRDPLFKLEKRIRTRIYCAFKAGGQTKSNRTWKYIDCSPSIFQRWIQYQLYDGMTLENYGDVWHIDHVIPCSKFDLSKQEDIDKCFSWQNLRPYLAHKNIQKYNKINQFEIVLQELKVYCFLRDNKSN